MALRPSGFVARGSLLAGVLLLITPSAGTEDTVARDETADQLIARSRAEIEAEHYHPAIATLARLLGQGPRRSDAALLLARADHLAGDNESALRVLE